jgi:hypothetical protein
MPKPSEPRSWGVWVYIVGDHEGLSGDEATEINRVATEEALKLVRAARGLEDIYLSVHVDLTNEKGSSIYRVPGVREPERRPEDRTSLESLVAFLRTEKADRPTAHNLVILWGHSGGPMGLFSDPDGVKSGFQNLKSSLVVLRTLRKPQSISCWSRAAMWRRSKRHMN